MTSPRAGWSSVRGHHAQECAVAWVCTRCCTRASRVTLPMAASSPPMLCVGPSTSRPPHVGSAEPWLGSRDHERCTAPLLCANVAAAWLRCETPSQYDYHMRCCRHVRVPPCSLSRAWGQADVMASFVSPTWHSVHCSNHLPIETLPASIVTSH